jgi:CRISPR/Cas system-associated exonuclease Cas4 (RecB family)
MDINQNNSICDLNKYGYNTIKVSHHANRSPVSEFGLRGYQLNGPIRSGVMPTRVVSVSLVISHTFCPFCAYVSFRDNKFVPTQYTVAGQVRHTAIERFFRSEEVLMNSGSPKYETGPMTVFSRFLSSLKNELEETYLNSYNSLDGKFEDLWNEIEILLVILYNRRVDSKVITDLPKRVFEIPLFSCDIGLKGRLDIIENRIFPLEIKTGSAPHTQYYLSHAIQLTLYALLLENKFRIDIDKGFIYYSVIDEKRQVLIDEKLRREAIRLRNLAIKAFLSPLPPESRCDKCENYKSERTVLRKT